MNERAEQIKKAMADEAFVNACLEAENEEAVQKLFADKGIEMSLTEIEIMKEIVGAIAEGKIPEEQLEKISNGGELSEEELAEAAGGNWFTTTYWNNIVDENGVSSAFSETVLNKGNIALTVVGGIVVAAGAAAGIAAACGVDVAGGISSAYNWCKEKITSRW